MRATDPAYARLSAPFEAGALPLADTWVLRNPGVPHPHSFCIYDQRYEQPHCCDFIFVTDDLVPRVTNVFYDTATQVSDHQPVLIEVRD